MFEIEAYHEVSGSQTCKLVMSSLVAELKSSNISYAHYDFDSNKFLSTTDLLRKQLGIEYAGKSVNLSPFNRYHLLICLYGNNMLRTIRCWIVNSISFCFIRRHYPHLSKYSNWRVWWIGSGDTFWISKISNIGNH